MRIDIVIPVYNGSSFIRENLSSIRSQTLQPRRIIVIDDRSTDTSVQQIRECGVPVELIQQHTNQGFSKTVNAGLACATDADAVLVLNQDIVLAPNFLQVMERTLIDTGAGVIGALLTYPDQVRVQHAGGWIQWPAAEAHHYVADAPTTPEFVTGAAVVLSRAALDRVGGFDVGISRAYYEDVDLCFRARAAGIGVLYQPAAKAIHHEGSVLGTNQYRHAWHFHCGRIGFLLRHGAIDQIESALLHEEQVCARPNDREDYLARTRAYLYQAMRMHDIRQRRSEIYPQRSAAENPDVWRISQERLLALAERYFEVTHHSSQEVTTNVEFTRNEGRLKEITFRSDIPILGALIARFRRNVHDIAGRWAIQYVIDQQSQINAHTLRAIDEMRRVNEDSVRRLFDLARRMHELESMRAAHDHDQSKY